MRLFEKIQEFIKKITKRTPQIEAPKVVKTVEDVNYGYVAPKGTREEDSTIESSANNLQVTNADLSELPVLFGNLEKSDLEELVSKIPSRGWTHEGEPTVSGKFNDKNDKNGFISVKRLNVGKNSVGQTIYTQNGFYDISTFKDNPKKGTYNEHLILEDGTDTSFYTNLGGNSSRVYREISRDGISLKESACLATMNVEAYEFENFAQPSNEFLEEYSKATGLPIIMGANKRFGENGLEAKTGLDMQDLTMTMRDQDPRVTFPYIVSIEASKQMGDGNKPKEKKIKYVYTSQDAYKNGESPEMIYFEGIDGRTGPSGMFRKLEDGTYVDNATVKIENGKCSFDKKSFEEIMQLAGKMPTKLSGRVNSAVNGKFKMPLGVQKIYEEAISKDIAKDKSGPEIDV